MSLSAAVLKRIAALPADVVGEVLSIIADVTAEEEVRKANQRERKARSRAGHGTVTGQERDSHSDAPPSKERSPGPPKETQPPGSDANASVSEPAVRDAQAKSRKRVYPDQLETFWRLYPTDRLMSKPKTAAVWARMGPEARDLAVASVPAFKAYCTAHPDYRPVHAVRYLSEERYVGFGPQELKSTGPPPGARSSEEIREEARKLWGDDVGKRGNETLFQGRGGSAPEREVPAVRSRSGQRGMAHVGSVSLPALRVVAGHDADGDPGGDWELDGPGPMARVV